MYRVHIFSMVCLWYKRPADKDGDRQHAIRVHRYPVVPAGADTGLHA
jgi:hypothetical protein